MFSPGIGEKRYSSIRFTATFSWSEIYFVVVVTSVKRSTNTFTDGRYGRGGAVIEFKSGVDGNVSTRGDDCGAVEPIPTSGGKPI
jgi:hypothetical protein